jgi:CRISPR/Cas system-associated protein endoribonuclease Cas2
LESKIEKNADPVTKRILENVIKRKSKYDLFKKRHKLAVWITLMLGTLFFIYIYFTIVRNYSYSFEKMFSEFVNNQNNLALLIVTIGTYGYMNLLKGKMEKAEKEFHELRCEIIDRSKDLWSRQDEWENRHFIFEMMKKDYDINLYHEKK